jgi:hypothetical protein
MISAQSARRFVDVQSQGLTRPEEARRTASRAINKNAESQNRTGDTRFFRTVRGVFGVVRGCAGMRENADATDVYGGARRSRPFEENRVFSVR